MKTIYLSKSNRADPSKVAAVRKILTDYNCNFVEYNGGGYDPSESANADLLICVTEGHFAFTQTNVLSVFVGKGQFGQINQKPTKSRPCFVVEFSEKIQLHAIRGSLLFDSDNVTSKYGRLFLGDGMDMERFLLEHDLCGNPELDSEKTRTILDNPWNIFSELDEVLVEQPKIRKDNFDGKNDIQMLLGRKPGIYPIVNHIKLDSISFQNIESIINRKTRRKIDDELRNKHLASYALVKQPPTV